MQDDYCVYSVGGLQDVVDVGVGEGIAACSHRHHQHHKANTVTITVAITIRRGVGTVVAQDVVCTIA